MNTLLVIQNRAIKAAQEERWEDAVVSNQEIIELDPQNVGALNRLGFCYLQLQKYPAAKKTYQQVLELDKTNSVAKKYLDVIARAGNQPVKLPKALRHSDFIDEPGKTKSIPLVRLAGQDVLDDLSIGAECQFKATKTRISVQCEGVYIGTLPDDIFLRLQPLVEAGNTYSIRLQSLKTSNVRIFVRELTRAVSVAHITSFPNETLGVLSMDHSELAREDEVPVMVAETGDDGDDQVLDTRGIDEALEEDDDYNDAREELDGEDDK
jgi:tetratricopeptide (TPR) repeat protein